MIKCYLSTLMGRERHSVADVMRQTGLTRTAITALYEERAKRVDLETIARLCELYECSVDELLEYVPD
jgi:putative transcriptional regulator